MTTLQKRMQDRPISLSVRKVDGWSMARDTATCEVDLPSVPAEATAREDGAALRESPSAGEATLRGLRRMARSVPPSFARGEPALPSPRQDGGTGRIELDVSRLFGIAAIRPLPGGYRPVFVRRRTD
ncbi:hypothetical protein [Jiella sonneratiae]|uniref:Uncharacterized protein n=1 Tax=Jiella sonneratiae TaxID=2816856 RepID=A0ABS3J2V6_9HYPH|nr:hypothetical protein [Jiella sonneratiae]MBO0903988.1 hypothetical protein [Jiella sonneratiae]